MPYNEDIGSALIALNKDLASRKLEQFIAHLPFKWRDFIFGTAEERKLVVNNEVDKWVFSLKVYHLKNKDYAIFLISEIYYADSKW